MKINDLEVVSAYLQASPEEQKLLVLTESQEVLLEKMRLLHEWLREEKSKKYMTGQLQQVYGVHQATAYRLIEKAYELFDFRQILIDNTLAELQKTKTAALHAGDLKAATNSDKNRLAFIKDFFGDSQQNRHKNRVATVITVGNFPELTGVQLPPEKELKQYIERVRSLKEAEEKKQYQLPPYTSLDSQSPENPTYDNDLNESNDYTDYYSTDD